MQILPDQTLVLAKEKKTDLDFWIAWFTSGLTSFVVIIICHSTDILMDVAHLCVQKSAWAWAVLTCRRDTPVRSPTLPGTGVLKPSEILCVFNIFCAIYSHHFIFILLRNITWKIPVVWYKCKWLKNYTQNILMGTVIRERRRWVEGWGARNLGK